jgi:hypothetical protein
VIVQDEVPESVHPVVIDVLLVCLQGQTVLNTVHLHLRVLTLEDVNKKLGCHVGDLIVWVGLLEDLDNSQHGNRVTKTWEGVTLDRDRALL